MAKTDLKVLARNKVYRETLARIIMNSLRGSGGIAPNSYTEWTDWRPEADAILASDWLAEVKRAERVAGAREALLSAADDFGHMWQADTVPALVVYQALRGRAAALGTGEEGQG